MSKNLGYGLGMICGIAVGLLFCVFFLRWTKKDHAGKCKFDERQELIRGRGAKYGFYTMMTAAAVYGIADILIGRQWIETMVAMLLICMSGIMVNSGYCIWNGSYFALNENPRRVLGGLGVIALLNFAIFARNARHGELVKDGVVQIGTMNFAVGILFVYIFALLLVKIIQNRREDD